MGQTKKTRAPLFIVMALIFFGGPAGIAALAYDYTKRGNYNATQAPESKTLFKQMVIAGAVILFLGSALGAIAADLVIPGASWLNKWLPTLTQGILGLVVTSRYLHKHNIYFTNKALWESQDFTKALTDLQAGDLAEAFKKTEIPLAASTTARSQPTNNNAAAPISPYAQNKNQAVIVIDQSGDKTRVKFIVLAIVILLMALVYQYLSSNPELFINAVKQFDQGVLGIEIQEE